MGAKEYNRRELDAGRLTIEHLLALGILDDLEKAVEVFQAAASVAGDYHGVIDGMAGPLTRAAIEKTTAPTRCYPMRCEPNGDRPTASANRFVLGKHDGLDFFRGSKSEHGWPNTAGKMVVAAQAGEVVYAYQAPNGFRFKLDHGDGWWTNYFHLVETEEPHPEKGDEVEMGADLARCWAQIHPPHLHFETKFGASVKKAVPKPPLDWLATAIYLPALLSPLERS